MTTSPGVDATTPNEQDEPEVGDDDTDDDLDAFDEDDFYADALEDA